MPAPFKHISSISLLSSGALLYAYFAHFVPRSEFLVWSVGYGLLFVAYVFIWQKATSRQMLFAAIGFRLIWLIALPPLSDDYHRFIWDGLLNLAGISPFSMLPSVLMQSDQAVPGISEALFSQLNSPDYFTIYPPVCQVFFTGAAFCYQHFGELGAVLFLRLMVWLGELPVFLWLPKLLAKWGLSPKLAFGYLLNPLVVIELTGNLHPEAWLIGGLVSFFYFWETARLKPALLGLWAAIAAKLLPLMLFPLLWKKWGLKQGFVQLFIVGISLLLSMIPFIRFGELAHWGSSINLYFQRFEFNASLYYLLREVGFWWKGYNLIAQFGPYLSIGALLSILSVPLFYPKKSTISAAQSAFQAAFWIWLIYLLTATIVHPWYLVTLLLFSLANRHRFPIVWTLTVFLSYHTYRTTDYIELGWVVAVEYLVVLGVAIGETFFLNSDSKLKEYSEG